MIGWCVQICRDECKCVFDKWMSSADHNMRFLGCIHREAVVLLIADTQPQTLTTSQTLGLKISALPWDPAQPSPQWHLAVSRDWHWVWVLGWVCLYSCTHVVFAYLCIGCRRRMDVGGGTHHHISHAVLITDTQTQSLATSQTLGLNISVLPWNPVQPPPQWNLTVSRDSQ